MTKPLIRIHNATTGEIIDREMNEEEYAQFLVDKANDEATAQAKIEAERAKNSLLEKLGITEEEARLLLS